MSPADDVKAVRAKLGLSQRKFARLIGSTQRSVVRWEMGDCEPSPHALARINALVQIGQQGRDRTTPGKPRQAAPAPIIETERTDGGTYRAATTAVKRQAAGPPLRPQLPAIKQRPSHQVVQREQSRSPTTRSPPSRKRARREVGALEMILWCARQFTGENLPLARITEIEIPNVTSPSVAPYPTIPPLLRGPSPGPTRCSHRHPQFGPCSLPAIAVLPDGAAVCGAHYASLSMHPFRPGGRQ
jgi:transcriptional regulator with XRE-family HTH domain